MLTLNLNQSEMNSAISIEFGFVSVPPFFNINFGSDNLAGFATNEDSSLLNDDFIFAATKGATYDVFSTSFFDPFLLRVADGSGINIAFDTNDIYSPYGVDHLRFVADSSTDHFVTASWHQGTSSVNKSVSVQVFEDLDTVIDYDRVFNWAESEYSDLLQGNPETQFIEGYNARIYGNNAVGEKDGGIYYYDGETIKLVGNTDGLLSQAIASGY